MIRIYPRVVGVLGLLLLGIGLLDSMHIIGMHADAVDRAGLLGLGQRIAQRDEPRRKRVGVGHHGLRAVVLGHDLGDERGGFAQRRATGIGHLPGTAAQALEIGLQRCQHVADHRNINHGNGAVERMHGTQQRLADAAITGRSQP